MIEFIATQIFGEKLPADLYTNFDAYAPQFVEYLSSAEVQDFAKTYTGFAPDNDPAAAAMYMIANDPGQFVDIIADQADGKSAFIDAPSSEFSSAASEPTYGDALGSLNEDIANIDMVDILHALVEPAYRDMQKLHIEVPDVPGGAKTTWERLTDYIWAPEFAAKLNELQTKAMDIGSVVADYVSASGDIGTGTAIAATAGIAGAVGASYIKARKIDLGLWWKGLSGQRQGQVSEDKRWRNVVGIARRAAVLIDHVAERSGITRGQAQELREEVTFFAPFAGAAYCQVTAEDMPKIEERLNNALRLDIEVEQRGADINAAVVHFRYRKGNEILTEGASLLLTAPDDIKLLIAQYLRAKEDHDFAERMLLKLEKAEDAQLYSGATPAC